MSGPTAPLKRIATLSTARAATGERPTYTLDVIEGGMGVLADAAAVVSAPPSENGVADVHPGDVLFGKLRPYLAKVLLVDRPGYASTELLCLRPGPDTEPRWLRYVMLSRPAIDWAIASSDGTKMPRTSWDRLGDFRIWFPDISSQRVIADFLDAETARIDALIAKKWRMVGLLDEADASLVDDVFDDVSEVRSVRLARVARLQTGLTLDSTRDAGPTAVTLPYLRVANVQAGQLDLSEVKVVTVPRDLASRCRLRLGDVLMTEGGDLDKLGRGTVWQGEVADCLHQNHVFAVRPDPARLLPGYLAMITRTSSARRYFESTGSRSTNLASTNSSKVLDLRVPLIPVQQQRDRLDRYEVKAGSIRRTRAALEHQIELLQEHRQALITAAVAGELESTGVAA